MNPEDLILDKIRDKHDEWLNNTMNSKELLSKSTYTIFENKDPFFRQYDKEYKEGSKFQDWTETSFFKPE